MALGWVHLKDDRHLRRLTGGKKMNHKGCRLRLSILVLQVDLHVDILGRFASIVRDFNRQIVIVVQLPDDFF